MTDARSNRVSRPRSPSSSPGAASTYLLSCVAQYGPTYYGSVGFAVPIGVPFILAVAWYILKAEEDEDDWVEAEGG